MTEQAAVEEARARELAPYQGRPDPEVRVPRGLAGVGPDQEAAALAAGALSESELTSGGALVPPRYSTRRARR